ncbi:TadE family protein [Bradymonas sediminis]|uniref:Pilus assembly protein n=1 Tax=Bradymonas sediminis TaxID=1548548 RepID=A0A2Z4FMZ2_9DELT|nr:TadE family protein [Bradymonas sediminis]AWV90210.1 hypothetical protein DN745_13045 [Bradymonas sediminis]
MPRKNEDNNSSPTPQRGSARAWGVRLGAHGLGVMATAALLLLPFVSRSTLEIVWESAKYTEFLRLSWLDALLFVGMAACLWALAVILFEVVSSRRAPVHKVLGMPRGSVMTETLVILPIFFLLTFGIAQLAVNNIAGLLVNAAVFQSGRTAWLWSSEADEGRRGVTSAMVKDLAHAQAAVVLAPVAPGEFIQGVSIQNERFIELRGVMMGSQLPAFSTDTGSAGKTAATGFLMGTNMTNLPEMDSSFSNALDTSSWPARTTRKLTFAFHASEVVVLEENSEVGVRLTYHHFQAFPMVGRIFGELKTDVGTRPGYYKTLERKFTMPAQINPNKKTP